MVETIPTLTYGTVTGRFLAAVADSVEDGDTHPDGVPLTGTVTFTPSAKAVLVSGVATVLPVPIEARLDDAGYISLNDVRGVELVASDSPNVNPQNFTYTVSFSNLRYGTAKSIAYPSFSITVPAGATVDLTDVAPVPSSSGVAIVRGEKGDPGEFDAAAVAPLYNDARAPFLKWTRALGKAQRGTGHAKLLAIGDSKTFGYPGGIIDSWTTQMQTRAGFPATTQNGAVIPGVSYIQPENKWVMGGWDTMFGPGSGALRSEAVATDSAEGAATYASGELSDTIDVYWYTQVGSGKFVVEIDGVAQPVIDTNSYDGDAQKYKKTTYKVTKGVHTLKFHRPTEGSVITFVDTFVDTTPSVRVANWGVSGSVSSTWASPGAGSPQGIEAWAPDLTLIMLGTNDGGQARPAANVFADWTVLINAAKKSGDVVLLSCVPSQAEGIQQWERLYAQESRAFAESLGIGFIDVFNKFGTPDDALFVDALHQNAVGNAQVARIVAAGLRNL